MPLPTFPLRGVAMAMSIACSAGKQSRVLATLLYGAGEDWLNVCPLPLLRKRSSV